MSAPTATVPKSNQDLWKDLVVGLKSFFTQGQDAGPDVKVYLPPFNSQAIPAGNMVDDAITNYALFQTADSLLPPDSPLYVLGSQSYINRLDSYLNYVETEPNNDPGAAQVLANAEQANSDARDDYYEKVLPKAQKYYTMETGKTPYGPEFEIWAVKKFPQLTQAKNHMQACAAAYFSTLQKVKGPTAVMVEKDRANMLLAKNLDSKTGCNMLCSSDPAPSTQKVPLVDTTYRPLYNLQQTYKGQVQGWINTSLDKKNNTFSVKFNSTNQASQDWANLGYENINVNGSANWWFASASFNADGQERTETVDTSTSSDQISCVLSARNYGVFTVAPDMTWDLPNVEKEFKLIDDAPKDLLTPMYRVASILVGYQVSLKVSMGSNLFQSLKSTFDKADQYGGSISIMGFNVSANSSSGTNTSFSSVKINESDNSFEIPASNSTYPVLLGALGRRTGGKS